MKDARLSLVAGCERVVGNRAALVRTLFAVSG